MIDSVSNSTAWIGLLLLFIILCLFLLRKCLSPNSTLNKLWRAHIGLGIAAVLLLLVHGLSKTTFLGLGPLAWLALLLIILTAVAGICFKRVKLVRSSWLGFHKLLSFFVMILIVLHLVNPGGNYFNFDENQGAIKASHQKQKNGRQPLADKNRASVKNETSNPEKSGSSSVRTFTLQELAKYNGLNGSPAYMAVNGIVYDLSSCKEWRRGKHEGVYAGQDLTAQFNQSIHNTEGLLDELPVVGRIVD